MLCYAILCYISPARHFQVGRGLSRLRPSGPRVRTRSALAVTIRLNNNDNNNNNEYNAILNNTSDDTMRSTFAFIASPTRKTPDKLDGSSEPQGCASEPEDVDSNAALTIRVESCVRDVTQDHTDPPHHHPRNL